MLFITNLQIDPERNPAKKSKLYTPGVYYHNNFATIYSLLMAIKQNTNPGQVSRLKRTFRWLRLHRILSTVIVLILAAGTYLAVSEIIWQIQVHSQRQSFYTTASKFNELQDVLTQFGSSHLEKYCYYESSPKEFVIGERYCVIKAVVSNQNLSRETAQIMTAKVLKNSQALFGGLTPESTVNDGSILEQDKYFYNGLNCSLTSVYYDSNVSVNLRENFAPSAGVANAVNIRCMGSAKANYFPVRKD